MPEFVDSSLLELAEQVSSKAKILQDYLERNKIASPSLVRHNAPCEYLEQGDADIKRVRAELCSAARQLEVLAGGPVQTVITQLLGSMHDTNCLRILWKYNVPRHVPCDGSISYKDLAAKSGFDEDKLVCTVQYAMLNYFLLEPEPGYVAHSTMSRLFLDDQAWGLLGHMMDDCAGAVARAPDAMDKWGSDTRAVNQTGMQLYLDTADDAFTHWGKTTPARMARFGDAMQFLGNATKTALFAFDWAKLGPVTLLDLGGSFGHSSIAIARCAPQIKCIVQDLPGTVDTAPPPPKDVAARVSFEAHDFFTPQPHTEMDVVFMSRILHDWPDAECHRILQKLVPAMKSGCRLILREMVKMPLYSAPNVEQRVTAMFDMQMMTLLNSRERTVEQWKVLITDGSGGQLKYEWHTAEMIGFIKQ